MSHIGSSSQLHTHSKIGRRLRNANIIFFTSAIVIAAIVMAMIMQSITHFISQEYAELYASKTIGRLNTCLNHEIGIIEKAANSPLIIDWFLNGRIVRTCVQ